ncbi:MAG: hypothetical protein ACTHOP_01600, partial [Mesorhizobium sp.]
DLPLRPNHQSTKRLLWVCALAAIAGIGLYGTRSRPEVLTAARILKTLDPECPGCGDDAYSKTILPHPMAFALLASIGAKTEDQNLLRVSANWLVNDASKKANAAGWGLGISWDAFGDKTVNPADTIYGITTALAISGLLDAYEKTGDRSYARVAISALDYYSTFFTPTDAGGFFWYSDQRADSINVYNVSSMLMGQYARAAKLFGRSDFAELATLAAEQLVADSKAVDGVRYWPYSAKSDRPNDAVHAAYTVQGFIEFAQFSDDATVPAASVEYLLSFYHHGRVLEFSPLHRLPSNLANRPARLWGVGMLIYTLSYLNRYKDARKIASVLDDYRVNGTDILANRPNDKGKGEPRMIAHIALGLAELRQSQCWFC